MDESFETAGIGSCRGVDERVDIDLHDLNLKNLRKTAKKIKKLWQLTFMLRTEIILLILSHLPLTPPPPRKQIACSQSTHFFTFDELIQVIFNFCNINFKTTLISTDLYGHRITQVHSHSYFFTAKLSRVNTSSTIMYRARHLTFCDGGLRDRICSTN